MAQWKLGDEPLEKWFVAYLKRNGLKPQSLACLIGSGDLSAKCEEIRVILRKDYIEILGNLPTGLRIELLRRTCNRLGNLYDEGGIVIAKTSDAFTGFVRMYNHFHSDIDRKVVVSS